MVCRRMADFLSRQPFYLGCYALWLYISSISVLSTGRLDASICFWITIGLFKARRQKLDNRHFYTEVCFEDPITNSLEFHVCSFCFLRYLSLLCP